MAAGHRAFGAARSVLDSREHDGILAASGPPMPPKPQLAAVYPRFLNAANSHQTDSPRCTAAAWNRATSRSLHR
jgi:hypothetical protein